MWYSNIKRNNKKSYVAELVGQSFSTRILFPSNHPSLNERKFSVHSDLGQWINSSQQNIRHVRGSEKIIIITIKIKRDWKIYPQHKQVVNFTGNGNVFSEYGIWHGLQHKKASWDDEIVRADTEHRLANAVSIFNNLSLS